MTTRSSTVVRHSACARSLALRHSLPSAPPSRLIPMYLSPRIWFTYVLLFSVAIPWYWRFVPGSNQWIWFGMPAWVTTAIGVSVVISALTSWLLQRPWPEEPGDPDLG